MADPKKRDVVGCITSLIGLVLLTPLRLVLLYGILSRIETPTWMWVLYFCYWPTALMWGICSAVVKLIDEYLAHAAS